MMHRELRTQRTADVGIAKDVDPARRRVECDGIDHQDAPMLGEQRQQIQTQGTAVDQRDGRFEPVIAFEPTQHMDTHALIAEQ